MQRGHRLSRSRDFDAVYRHGRSVSTRYLVLYWFERENDDGERPRLGVAVPKKVGGSVIRNRIKRRLREAWAHLSPEPRNDYVLVVRPGLPGGGRVARLRLARGAGRRGPAEGAGMKYLGIALVYALPLAGLAAAAGGIVQVPPQLLAVRDRRPEEVRASARHGQGGHRIARCHPWSHGGVDYA